MTLQSAVVFVESENYCAALRLQSEIIAREVNLMSWLQKLQQQLVRANF